MAKGKADTPSTATAGRCDDSSDQLVCHGWLLNDEETSQNLGDGILVNVQSVEIANVGSEDYVHVEASGVPNYSHRLTSAEVEQLNARPRAALDFRIGQTLAQPGDVIEFGQDVGYESNRKCEDTGGFGYWPPGPECPVDVGLSAFFPLSPAEADTTCYAGLGTIGVLVNGVAIFSWSDGASFDNANVWHTVASKAEAYDVGICGGHAAMGTYHQHFVPNCLAEQLEDDGSGHSPMYGLAADGYPVYGPYFDSGVRARSCWKTRDYDDPNSETGCGAAGERTCVLVDPLDVKKGVKSVVAGPRTDETVTSLSGNEFLAEPGFYFEDYWFDADCAANGGEDLDEHNGHQHGDLGYHYHFTETFPYDVGPSFRGSLHDNAIARCSASPIPMAGPSRAVPPRAAP